MPGWWPMRATLNDLGVSRLRVRRLASRSLDALPGGSALKRCYRRVRPVHAEVARRVERWRVRLTPIGAGRARTFGWVVGQLGLEAAPAPLLRRLRSVMTRADLADLLALLDFVEPATDQSSRSTPVTIRHARDLEPVEAPARRTILFVTGEFPNPMHGGGTRVSDFIKLMSRHHTIHLLTVYVEHQDRAAYEAIRPYCDRIVTASYEEFEAMTNGLDRFADVGPIDVIHYEWPRALRHVRRAAAGRHVYTCHEAVSLRLLLDLGRLGDDDPAYLPTLVKLLTSLKIEVVDAAPLDACIALTERDAAFLARFNPAMRHYVVNHGVTLDEFTRSDREPEPRSLLYIGNYQHYPNEDAVRFFFREIYGLVRQRIPDARVYIVGANPTPNILAYHDGQRVIVTGPVAELGSAIQRAAVCIAPLVTGAGLRTKVIQYAALRRPAVVTSLAAADLLFEHGADLLIADEPAAFADYVADLLQQPERARSMAASAYDKVCRYYDNRRIVGQLYRVYDLLAASEGNPSTYAMSTGLRRRG